MAHPFSEPRLVCRPALPSDSADVLEFTKYIWDGNDYIKYVWQDWFDDPHGLLAVAQLGKQAVGMAKVTLLTSGQWWLEGLRVDPDFQGQKIGSRLHEYMDAWWLAHGDGTLRLMTSSMRVQVHHLCERTGFQKVGEITGYDTPNLPGKSAFESVPVDQVPQAVSFIAQHASDFNALMDWGWRFSAPDETTLAEAAHRQQLFWWRGRMALFANWEDTEDSKLGVGLVSCRASQLADLLMDVRRFAAEKQMASVRWHAPSSEGVQASLQAAGFTTDWDASAFLYAKQHPGS